MKNLKEKILLFIPAYNCEKQIVRVLGQLDDSVMKYITEVVVINNLSTDSTEDAVIRFIEKHPDIPVKLLRNNENYGLGGSHKSAFAYAKANGFDYVIVLHGDDQGDIHNLLPVLRKEIYKKYDCCLGARFMNGSKLEGYSKFRTFGNVVYNLLFSMVTKRRVLDLGSGLNMYRVGMLEQEFYKKFPDNLMFNYCMILAADYYKHKICFFPIMWREEDQVSNVKMFNQAVTVLKMLFSYAVNPKEFISSECRENKIMRYGSIVVAESGKLSEEE